MEKEGTTRPAISCLSCTRIGADCPHGVTFNANDTEDKESVANALKPDINAFLWTRLPRSVSLGEADLIAESIHELIWERWEKVRP